MASYATCWQNAMPGSPVVRKMSGIGQYSGCYTDRKSNGCKPQTLTICRKPPDAAKSKKYRSIKPRFLQGFWPKVAPH